jgi:hypothetical protein
MVKVIPNQSGMDFIADNTFHVEESCLYKNIGDGVRSVEFVRVIEDRLLFVEAKTSFPDPDTPSEENKLKFQKEIDEVLEKFTHSLNLLSSVEVGAAESEYPDDFSIPDRVSLVFLLVVKNHEFKWCRRIKSKLESDLPRYLKNIWKPMVLVINQDVAIRRGLITS